MGFERVRSAYGARADEYVDAVGRVEHVVEADRARILDWAGRVDGPVLDVGSGPGQWTDFLRRAGVRISGIEPVPEFLSAARRDYPDSRFEEGRAEHLPVADGALGGILAWFSLIHTEPAELDVPLREFARAIRPGGSLLVGCFTGASLAPFDHAVTTAYYWPVDLLAERLESAGFAVAETHVPGGGKPPTAGRRAEATLIAVR